ncbi:hypothetical protein BH23PLA1_BH23PLA1_26450 [soil metagenome]
MGVSSDGNRYSRQTLRQQRRWTPMQKARAESSWARLAGPAIGRIGIGLREHRKSDKILQGDPIVEGALGIDGEAGPGPTPGTRTEPEGRSDRGPTKGLSR